MPNSHSADGPKTTRQGHDKKVQISSSKKPPRGVYKVTSATAATIAKDLTAYMSSCAGTITTSSYKIYFIAVIAVWMEWNYSGTNLLRKVMELN